MAEIVLDQVTKAYPDGTVAVSGLDLSIGDGEFVVLVGPSGCGKTTALRMVAGLEDVTEGRICIGDRLVNNVPARDRDIAMVFQNYALYPHLSVAENLGFGLKLRKVAKHEIKRRVEEAATILGIGELLARKPRALSGGQRQRVAMGRAIVREPEAFLMDEPLSNLDAKLRVQMRAEVSRIQRDLCVTTLYVTHDQTEAMTMGDRVAVMKRGVLQQVEAPQVLYDRPVNIFVGGFIGSPAMNLVEATLDSRDGHIAAVFGGQRLEIPEHHRPSVEEYVGRNLVVGIRPEDMEDASFATGAPAEQRIEAAVELVEQMGSEAYVHFEVDAPPVLTEDTRELARDVGLAEVEGGGGQQGGEERSTFVARVSPRTKAAKGDRMHLVVDTTRLHFFVPESGLSVGPEAPATTTGAARSA